MSNARFRSGHLSNSRTTEPRQQRTTALHPQSGHAGHPGQGRQTSGRTTTRDVCLNLPPLHPMTLAHSPLLRISNWAMGQVAGQEGQISGTGFATDKYPTPISRRINIQPLNSDTCQPHATAVHPQSGSRRGPSRHSRRTSWTGETNVWTRCHEAHDEVL
jgi:hypothetical protein